MKRIFTIIGVLFCAFLFGLPESSNAQITITASGVTANSMMNKLLGPGVIGFNAVSTCHDSSKGIFRNAVTSPLIFDSGVCMSSGAVVNGPMPGGSSGIGMAGPASGFASWDNPSPGAPWLGALTGGTSFDACFFEFDFRPAGDTVKFDYVFGSEEYTGYTCSGFNDPFGFLISGPGFATPTNIALVPGTNIPVCINSINCGPILPPCTAMGPGSPFCAYYINNTSGTLMTFDGITTKLTAIAAVTPCDTYHLKLGVSDISDGVLDSGVWLKAGSLTSTALSVSPVGMHPGDTVAGAQFCVRNCLPGKFVFRRSGSMTNPLTIKYLIGGTAVNGADYTTIPDSVVIPASDSDEVVYIYGLSVPPTGPKTVKIFILAPYTCGGAPVVVDSGIITILDSFQLKIQTPDTAICQGQWVNIRAMADTLLDVNWVADPTLSSTTILNPTATPSVTTTYTLTGVYSTGGCPTSRATLKVTVYRRPTLNPGAPIQTTCQGTTLQLNLTVFPTGIPYTYAWTPTTYLDNPAAQNPKFTPGDSVDRWQNVRVSAPVANCYTDTSIFLHVLPNDFQLFNLDTGICFKQLSTYQIRLLGDTEFTYKWTPAFGVSNPNIMQPIISPMNTITYTVTASYPRCPDIKHTVQYSIKDPRVNILTQDTTVCLGQPMPLRVAVGPTDSPFTFYWTPTTYFVDVVGTTQPHFFTKIPGTYVYNIVVNSLTDNCGDTDQIKITVAPPVDLVIKPGNTKIKYGQEIQLEAVRLSADDLIYTWVPNDGSLNNPNINNPVAKPLDSTTYIVYGMNQWGCRDSAIIAIDVDIDMNEYIPSAFTPNGDGLNDLFRIRGLRYQRLVDFKVYNRWGEVVYDYKSGDAQGWDGTFNGQKADMGVYHYVVILGKLGEPERVYKGEVTLIR